MQMNVSKGLLVIVTSGNEKGIPNLATSWCQRSRRAPQVSVSQVTADLPKWYETRPLPHEDAALRVLGHAPR